MLKAALATEGAILWPDWRELMVSNVVEDSVEAESYMDDLGDERTPLSPADPAA